MVKCNVPKRGWINGVGGCPNVGGICIGCTMPGFPDKFMPFMDEPPGAQVSTRASQRLRLDGPPAAGDHRRRPLDKEPKWRQPGTELTHRREADLVEGGARHDHDASLGGARAGTGNKDLVEMAWDPITRIVGSLGIYTKIDFANRTVAECNSTSSIFRGY